MGVTVWGAADEDGSKYGAHWWVGGFGKGQTFSCNGYNGQHAIAVPAHQLVVVRLGVSPDDERGQKVALAAQLVEVVGELCAQWRSWPRL